MSVLSMMRIWRPFAWSIDNFAAWFHDRNGRILSVTLELLTPAAKLSGHGGQHAQEGVADVDEL